MKSVGLILGAAMLSTSALAMEPLVATQTAFDDPQIMEDQIVLKNDSFRDDGGQAYLQLGFVTEEKAGIWVQVPEEIQYFKVEAFRVLMGSADGNAGDPKVIFFHGGIADTQAPQIPATIENAAQITPGPFFNDVPMQDVNGMGLDCARGGQYVGAALEFTHDGAPSVYRDIDGLTEIKNNVLFAVNGGWRYSVQYGLRGDWVLRIVGSEATAEECGMEE